MPNEKSVFDINGTQFPLHDANAVKYDRTQALTDAQKQQARGNIGALGQASIYNGLDKQVLGFALDAYQGKVINDSKTAVQNGLAIIVDGDTASMAVPVGSYAYIKNNVHGLSEGLYTNTSASAFPASGGMADSTVFTPVSGGGLNAIQQSLAGVETGTIVRYPAIASGTVDNMALTKVGNTVFASARLHSINPAVSALREFFKVPTGFCPKVDTSVMGYIVIDGTFIPILAKVQTDGSVFIGYSSNKTTNQVAFVGTWSVI